MHISSHFVRPVLGVFLAFVLFVTVIQQADAIRNGSLFNGRMKSVFMMTLLVDPPENGTDHVGVGTVSNVKYERCMVTAQHVATASLDTIVMGNDLTTITNDHKRQSIVGGWHAPELGALDLRKFYLDFSVGWMQNLQDGAKKRIQAKRDYEPLELAKVETLGLGAVETGTGLSANAPKQVRIEGYGHNETVVGDTMYDRGSSVRRTGSPDAVLWRLGGPFQAGSYVRTVATEADIFNTIACRGDSGGPLSLPDGSKIFGVLSTGSTQFCFNETQGNYSAFDDTNATGGKTNWERINALIKTTCGIHVFGFKWPHGDGGSGYVSGQLEGGQEWPPIEGIQFNETILSGDGTPNQDIREFVHEGQNMILTAVPDAYSSFVRWEQYGINTPYGNCPCYGSTNPVCRMDYDDLGYYDEDTSLDASACYAVFGPYEEPPTSSSEFSSFVSSDSSSSEEWSSSSEESASSESSSESSSEESSSESSSEESSSSEGV